MSKSYPFMCPFFWKTYLFGKSRIHIQHTIFWYILSKKSFLHFGYTSKFMSSYANQKVVLHQLPLRCAGVPGAARIEWHHWSSWLETFVGSLTLPGSQKAKNVAHPLQKKGGWNFEDVFFLGWTTWRYSVLMWFTRVYYPDNSEVALKNEFTNK